MNRASESFQPRPLHLVEPIPLVEGWDDEDCFDERQGGTPGVMNDPLNPEES